MLEWFLKTMEGRNGNTLTATTDLVATLQATTLERYREAVSGLRELAANAEDDEALGGGDDELRRRWFQLNTMTNDAAVDLPELEEAQALLQMEVGSAQIAYQSRVEGVAAIPVRPHQVTGVAGLLEMLASPLHFALLCDSVGLGKTRLLCALIHELASLMSTPGGDDGFAWPPAQSEACVRRSALARNLRGPYAPTIVIIPANASATWKAEGALWERAGLLKVHYWLANQVRAGGKADVNGKHLPASVASLKQFLGEFDANDPDTMRSVIITSITCFASRTTAYEEGYVRPSKRQRAEDDDDAAPERMAEEAAAHSYSELAGLAALVVIDEVHKFKSVATLCHNSVRKLRPRLIVGLTATPVWNTAVDMIGPLSLLAGTRERGLVVDDDDAEQVRISGTR
jgi:SNF2 family DNA or RNA helicase